MRHFSPSVLLSENGSEPQTYGQMVFKPATPAELGLLPGLDLLLVMFPSLKDKDLLVRNTSGNRFLCKHPPPAAAAATTATQPLVF